MSSLGQAWAIVLAAGEGTRLQSLVRLVHGDPLPKQFATLIGSRSMLQMTVERLNGIAPPSQMMVVVTLGQDELARRQLADWPDLEMVVQPQNRGTALGILLSLTRLRRRDPDASVAIFPADHYVPRPGPFVEGVGAMVRSNGVALLGLVPDRADPDLGWIVPGPALGGGLNSVAQFIEKPDRAVAAKLFRGGALWNSFVIAGRVRELWSLARAHLPTAADAFERATGGSAIDELYARLPSTDFSRAVLEKARSLEVARVEGSGWADWGTPERVVDSLDGTPALDLLLRRIIDGQRRAFRRGRTPNESVGSSLGIR